MRRVFVGTVSALLFVPSGAASYAQVAGDKIPDSYVCVFKASAVARGREADVASEAVRAEGGQVGFIYSKAIHGFSVRLASQAVERITHTNPAIDYCEQDQVVTLIPYRATGKRPSGGTISQPAQETPWGVARVNGGGVQGPFATAWIIDTGIDPTHPDLNVDGARSKTFVSRTRSFADENGHGTHVAGTIGALSNTIGVIGVAPGAPLVAVRVLDKSGSGSISGVIAGIDYVATAGRPGDVANMSLGGGASTTLDNAVINAAAFGIRFALAAGNNAANANNYSSARVNGVNIYTVSAFSVGDLFASFSNYGNPPIDFSEPGVDIKSTWLGGGYNTISGTSMETPHLAGLLLVGAISNGGYVIGDPDGRSDIIGSH